MIFCAVLIFGFYGELKAASELIKANVEPVLEQYRPVILASLSFSKFTLGTVAPQFTGLVMHYLDTDFAWSSSLFSSSSVYCGLTLCVHIETIKIWAGVSAEVWKTKMEFRNQGHFKKAFEDLLRDVLLLSSALDNK